MTVPRVFGLPHLSEDAVAAFADGVLSATAATRARRHCTECTECAEAVRGQREAAMMLRGASSPSAPAGLLDRLAGLPMSAPLPPPRSGLPTTLGADGVPVFIAHCPPRKAPDTQRSDGEHQSIAQPAGHGHRRGLLPVTIFASAAAVVAAGTLGGSVSSFQASLNQPPAANVASHLFSNDVQLTSDTSGSGSATTPGRRQVEQSHGGPTAFGASPALLMEQAFLSSTVDRHHPAP